jgi:arylsulfatase A-like enzyme
MPNGKPNILIIWGDDIGISNLSCYSDGLMGYRTPNIDRVANEGMRFIHYYGEQSCTAGRAAFMTGQSVFRTGLSKVGMPGVPLGFRAEDPSIAELLKPLGYRTGQYQTLRLMPRLPPCVSSSLYHCWVAGWCRLYCWDAPRSKNP